MLEQKHFKLIGMIKVSGGGVIGRAAPKYSLRIMEHRVIPKLKAVNGDKPYSAKGIEGTGLSKRRTRGDHPQARQRD